MEDLRAVAHCENGNVGARVLAVAGPAPNGVLSLGKTAGLVVCRNDDSRISVAHGVGGGVGRHFVKALHRADNVVKIHLFRKFIYHGLLGHNEEAVAVIVAGIDGGLQLLKGAVAVVAAPEVVVVKSGGGKGRLLLKNDISVLS